MSTVYTSGSWTPKPGSEEAPGAHRAGPRMEGLARVCERMARVQVHVNEFHPTELGVIAAAQNGTVSTDRE